MDAAEGLSFPPRLLGSTVLGNDAPAAAPMCTVTN